MARLNIAPTKSNLLSVKEHLAICSEGYDLLEQKRELLVMELMNIMEQIKLLEREIDKCVEKAYPALKATLIALGGDRVERIARSVNYTFKLTKRNEVIAGITFTSVDVELPERQLFSSYRGTSAESDEAMAGFFDLLTLLTKMANIRTVAWRLAREVKKTQRRVNALEKIVIPQDKETVKYIDSVLEERERDNVFVMKSLKKRRGEK